MTLFEYAAAVKVYPIGIPIEVCDKFEELALMLKRERHFRRYSADAILHQIRWFYTIERRRRGFKINNDWSAVLARWAMKNHADLDKFFELRVRRKDQGGLCHHL